MSAKAFPLLLAVLAVAESSEVQNWKDEHPILDLLMSGDIELVPQQPCTAEDDCNNHGTASGTRENCQCACDPGWAGATCSYEPCSAADCSGHGAPFGNHPDCGCKCEDGWQGSKCQEELCQPEDCNNHGVASGTRPGNCTCDCEADHPGEFCGAEPPIQGPTTTTVTTTTRLRMKPLTAAPTTVAPPTPKIPMVPFEVTAVKDPNPIRLPNTQGQPPEKLQSCIPQDKPCRMLFLNQNSTETAPFKFYSFETKSTCCFDRKCVERDVAALSFFRNDYEAGTVESVGSIAYCL